jgi:hypothetical protein
VESAVSLTLNEAGYVVEQSNTAINRAVDRGVIKAKLQRRGKIRLRNCASSPFRERSSGSLPQPVAGKSTRLCGDYRRTPIVWRLAS